ncbi:FAD-dependent oxidoreductase [Longispora sp. NPDC051575]|uniref:NAD(P)/FAD-dependent oxidoreductase n=1 Tax=Longispora sp. NPDC051575 TaxID=3154943 RepID=UPI003419D210
MRLVIVGGGFAGVWAAAAAARVRQRAARDLEISVVSPGPDLVLRPRLYQADPAAMRVPLAHLLGPIGVDHQRAAVTGIDVATGQIRAGAATHGFDRLVLASGSHLVTPDLPGAGHLHDIDTIESATALDAHLHSLAGRHRTTAVVVGAGFTGLELATELVHRLRVIGPEPRVVLVERAPVLAPDLGPGPRPVALDALARLGVDLRLGVTVREVGRSHVDLSDGTTLPADTVVWTAGQRASALTAQFDAPRDHLGRLRVDPYLRVEGTPTVYAAGDTAAAPAGDARLVTQSCQHAIQTGKRAGANAAADLLGLPLDPFRANPYVTCLDLGAAGAVYTTGWERSVLHVGQEAKDHKNRINEEYIYPPLNDAGEFLRRADPATVPASAVV